MLMLEGILMMQMRVMQCVIMLSASNHFAGVDSSTVLLQLLSAVVVADVDCCLLVSSVAVCL